MDKITLSNIQRMAKLCLEMGEALHEATELAKQIERLESDTALIETPENKIFRMMLDKEIREAIKYLLESSKQERR
jgi:hypothetical protein